MMTPVTHRGEKSFSLNLQQVKCGQSAVDSSVQSGAPTMACVSGTSFYRSNHAPTPKQAVDDRIRLNFQMRQRSTEEEPANERE